MTQGHPRSIGANLRLVITLDENDPVEAALAQAVVCIVYGYASSKIYARALTRPRAGPGGRLDVWSGLDQSGASPSS